MSNGSEKPEYLKKFEEALNFINNVDAFEPDGNESYEEYRKRIINKHGDKYEEAFSVSEAFVNHFGIDTEPYNLKDSEEE